MIKGNKRKEKMGARVSKVQVGGGRLIGKSQHHGITQLGIFALAFTTSPITTKA